MCDRDMMVNYIESYSDLDVRACLNAISDPSLQHNCECWSGLDQSWVYANFDCKWEEDDEETLLQQYPMYCTTERTK